MSRSLISFIILVCCLFLWYFSGLLTKKLKIFKNMEGDKLQKCQIYIFELFGLTYAISYLLHAKTFNIIFKANDYADIGPQETLNLTRSLSALVWLMYMVCLLCFCLCFILSLISQLLFVFGLILIQSAFSTGIQISTYIFNYLYIQYCIEMLTNQLRWSLKLHHIVVIIATTYFMLILDDYADLASLRWYVLLFHHYCTSHYGLFCMLIPFVINK